MGCLSEFKCRFTFWLQPGKRGGGGEYEAQDGFGWTNGVFLYFLHKYGNRISSDDSVYGSSTSFICDNHMIRYLFVMTLNVVLTRYVWIWKKFDGLPFVWIVYTYDIFADYQLSDFK